MKLLLDALRQTLADPANALSWHRLFEIWSGCSDESKRQQLLGLLIKSPQTDVSADVFRLTFLRDVTNDPAYAMLAATRALAGTPAQPDRLATLAAYSWAYAVKRQRGKFDFGNELIQVKLPELCAKLAEFARTTLPKEFYFRVPEKLGRVAIIAPYLGNGQHTPSVMVANHAHLLANANIPITIFSAQELRPPHMLRFHGTTSEVLLSQFDPSYWQRSLPVDVELTVSDTRFSLYSRWQELTFKIAEYDPDVIFFCGLYSPLAAALYTCRPVVGLNVHAVPPLSPVDVWLSSRENRQREQPWLWNLLSKPPVEWDHPYRINKKTQEFPISRKDFGIQQDSIVWITVGGRLEHEINGAWAQSVSDIFSRYENVVWLLVGGNGNIPETLAGLVGSRLLVLGNRDDVSGLLKFADIYVNPERMGGGFSVAEAMAAGLPVVSFSDSDGGDKLGAYAVSTIDDYLIQLTCLTESRPLRREVGDALRARFAQRLDLAQSSPSLIAALQRAIVYSRDRLGKT